MSAIKIKMSKYSIKNTNYSAKKNLFMQCCPELFFILEGRNRATA